MGYEKSKTSFHDFFFLFFPPKYIEKLFFSSSFFHLFSRTLLPFLRICSFFPSFSNFFSLKLSCHLLEFEQAKVFWKVLLLIVIEYPSSILTFFFDQFLFQLIFLRFNMPFF